MNMAALAFVALLLATGLGAARGALEPVHVMTLNVDRFENSYVTYDASLFRGNTMSLQSTTFINSVVIIPPSDLQISLLSFRLVNTTLRFETPAMGSQRRRALFGGTVANGSVVEAAAVRDTSFALHDVRLHSGSQLRLSGMQLECCTLEFVSLDVEDSAVVIADGLLRPNGHGGAIRLASLRLVRSALVVRNVSAGGRNGVILGTGLESCHVESGCQSPPGEVINSTIRIASSVAQDWTTSKVELAFGLGSRNNSVDLSGLVDVGTLTLFQWSPQGGGALVFPSGEVANLQLRQCHWNDTSLVMRTRASQVAAPTDDADGVALAVNALYIHLQHSQLLRTQLVLEMNATVEHLRLNGNTLSNRSAIRIHRPFRAPVGQDATILAFMANTLSGGSALELRDVITNRELSVRANTLSTGSLISIVNLEMISTAVVSFTTNRIFGSTVCIHNASVVNNGNGGALSLKNTHVEEGSSLLLSNITTKDRGSRSVFIGTGMTMSTSSSTHEYLLVRKQSSFTLADSPSPIVGLTLLAIKTDSTSVIDLGAIESLNDLQITTDGDVADPARFVMPLHVTTLQVRDTTFTSGSTWRVPDGVDSFTLHNCDLPNASVVLVARNETAPMALVAIGATRLTSGSRIEVHSAAPVIAKDVVIDGSTALYERSTLRLSASWRPGVFADSGGFNVRLRQIVVNAGSVLSVENFSTAYINLQTVQLVNGSLSLWNIGVLNYIAFSRVLADGPNASMAVIGAKALGANVRIRADGGIEQLDAVGGARMLFADMVGVPNPPELRFARITQSSTVVLHNITVVDSKAGNTAVTSKQVAEGWVIASCCNVGIDNATVPGRDVRKADQCENLHSPLCPPDGINAPCLPLGVQSMYPVVPHERPPSLWVPLPPPARNGNGSLPCAAVWYWDPSRAQQQQRPATRTATFTVTPSAPRLRTATAAPSLTETFLQLSPTKASPQVRTSSAEATTSPRHVRSATRRPGDPFAPPVAPGSPSVTGVDRRSASQSWLGTEQQGGKAASEDADLAASAQRLRDSALANTKVAVPAAAVVATAWSAASAGLSIGGGGGPASVSRFSRLAAIGGTLRCGEISDADVEAPDFTEHPFQPELAFGADAATEASARVNGAAVMSTLLSAVALVAELLVFFGYVTATGAMLRVTVAVSIAVPSFFAPGVAALSTAAVFSATTTALGALHGVCLLVGVGVCAVYFTATIKAPEFVAVSSATDAPMLEDTQPPRRAFVASFGLLVDGLKHFPGSAATRLFFAEEVAASVVMSVLSALPAVSHAACVRRAAAVLVVSVAHAGYAAATRPLRSTVETVGTLVVAALQVAFSATALVAVQALPDVREPTPALLEAGAMAFVVALFLLPVAVAIDELFFKKSKKKATARQAPSSQELVEVVAADRNETPLLAVPESATAAAGPVVANPLARGNQNGSRSDVSHQ